MMLLEAPRNHWCVVPAAGESGPKSIGPALFRILSLIPCAVELGASVSSEVVLAGVVTSLRVI